MGQEIIFVIGDVKIMLMNIMNESDQTGYYTSKWGNSYEDLGF